MSPFAVKLSVILFIGRIALKLKCTTLLPARQNSSRPWRKRKIPCQDVICCPSWCFWVRQNWRCGAFQLRILSRHLLKKEAKLKTHWMLGNLPNDFIGDKNTYSGRALYLSLKSVCCLHTYIIRSHIDLKRHLYSQLTVKNVHLLWDPPLCFYVSSYSTYRP